MNNKMIAALALIIAASYAAWTLLVSPSKAGEDNLAIMIPEFSEIAQSGQVAFEQKCAECHGINAVGTDKGPPLLHAYYKSGHHGDVSFAKAALYGVGQHHWPFGDMPPVEDITEEEIIVIVKYVRELQAANGY